MLRRDILTADMTPEKPQNYWQDDQAQVPAPNAEPVQPGLPMVEPDLVTEPIAEESAPVEAGAPEPSVLPSEQPITWSAEEYVHAQKGPLWFIAFIVIVLAFVAIDVFFLKSWTFSALVIVMAVTLAIYIRRPARTLTYALSPQQGLYVGEKLYNFDEFKSFGVIQDGENFSIMLIPRKRF